MNCCKFNTKFVGLCASLCHILVVEAAAGVETLRLENTWHRFNVIGFCRLCCLFKAFQINSWIPFWRISLIILHLCQWQTAPWKHMHASNMHENALSANLNYDKRCRQHSTYLDNIMRFHSVVINVRQRFISCELWK